MRVLKIIATALLGVVLFAALLVFQTLLLACYTALDPAYYGAPQQPVYAQLSDVAVRVFSDIVAEQAPPEAWRSADRDGLYALARDALPKDMAQRMLQAAGPDIVRYALRGGAPPVLGDAEDINATGLSMLGAVLKDGALVFIPTAQLPKLTDYLPFTPTWNSAHAAWMDRLLRPVRLAWAQRGNFVWIAGGAVLFASSFLYLLWMRSPRPFYLLCGWVLMAQSALWVVLALGLRFFHGQVTAFAMQIPGLHEALTRSLQPRFAAALPDLASAALQPFSVALGMAAAIVFSFSLLCFGVAQERGMPILVEPLPRRPKLQKIKTRLKAKPAQ